MWTLRTGKHYRSVTGKETGHTKVMEIEKANRYSIKFIQCLGTQSGWPQQEVQGVKKDQHQIKKLILLDCVYPAGSPKKYSQLEWAHASSKRHNMKRIDISSILQILSIDNTHRLSKMITLEGTRNASVTKANKTRKAILYKDHWICVPVVTS